MTTEPAFDAAAKADTAPSAAASIKAAPPKRPAPQPIADDIETSRTRLRDDGWHDQLEDQVRGSVRTLIQALIEAELAEALGRARYKRLKSDMTAAAAPAANEGLGDEVSAAAAASNSAPAAGSARGHRNGRRVRTVMGTFGKIDIAVPRARIDTDEPGKTAEWKTKILQRYQRRTKEVDALITGAYLSGTNTRRVGRALGALFGGPVISKSVVSRVWRKIKADWDNWNKRDLADDDIVRLILDGTHVKVRMDKKATGVSLLVVLGIRRDGQKVLLSVKNMGGESEAASWRSHASHGRVRSSTI